MKSRIGWIAMLLSGVLVARAGTAEAPPPRRAWEDSLAKMPLVAPVRELNRSNCVEVLLQAFGSNDTVRALVFMPGACDELYFFQRVKAALTNPAPTLLDAVVALTNQTYIRVTWRPPLLLLHTQEDDTEPLSKVTHEGTAAGLRERKFLPHAVFHDYDWDHLMPILEKQLKVGFRPWKGRFEANHFYRHSLAAWNLTGWEALEAVSLAGKTTFTVQRGRVVFEGDERFPAPPPGPMPPLPSFERLFPQATNLVAPARP